MYGMAIKLWCSEFDNQNDEFKVNDSVVYLCQDIVNKDIIYLSTVIKHLVGDDSLEEIFRKYVPLVQGEHLPWEEPLVKIEEQDYASDIEEGRVDDGVNFYNFNYISFNIFVYCETSL